MEYFWKVSEELVLCFSVFIGLFKAGKNLTFGLPPSCSICYLNFIVTLVSALCIIQ